MNMQSDISPRSREMATCLLGLIDAINRLRNNIAMVLNVNPGNVSLGIAKDGIAFDLTVILSATDDAARLAQMLEIVGVDGVAFRDIQTKPPLGTSPRRITARALSPEQTISIAA